MCRNNRCKGDCVCRVNAVNIFSADFRAGQVDGRKGEAERTTAALIELRDKQILGQLQFELTLDLILEKFIDSLDID